MKTKADIWWLSVTGALFGLFFLDVLLGKAALEFDFKPMLKLGDVGEFLVLFAAVICFIVEVLRRELQENELKTEAANRAEEES